VKSLLLIQAAFSHFSFAAPLPLDPARNGALATGETVSTAPYWPTFSAADRGAWGGGYPDRQHAQPPGQPSQRRPQPTAGAPSVMTATNTRGIDHPTARRKNSPMCFCEATTSTGWTRKRRHLSTQFTSVRAHSDSRHPEILWAAISAAGWPERVSPNHSAASGAQATPRGVVVAAVQQRDRRLLRLAIAHLDTTPLG